MVNDLRPCCCGDATADCSTLGEEHVLLVNWSTKSQLAALPSIRRDDAVRSMRIRLEKAGISPMSSHIAHPACPLHDAPPHFLDMLLDQKNGPRASTLPQLQDVLPINIRVKAPAAEPTH